MVLLSPDDRELIPSTHFFQASSPIPIPIGVDMGPVKPLGKVPGYDDKFAALLDECREAIDQGTLEVRSAPEYQKVGFFIGNLPLPEGEPNPSFIYQIYRVLATDGDVISAVSRGVEHLPPMSDAELEALAPQGMDDSNITYLPEKTLYSGFCASEEERLFLTRLSHARLGALVRSLAISEVSGLHPFTTDQGMASVIQLLDRRAGTKLAELSQTESNRALMMRLGLLHKLIVGEFIDADMLDRMSVRDVLKLRTKAWGRAGEARARLGSVAIRLALSTQSIEEFEKVVRYELNEYLKSRSDLDAELGNLKINVLADLIKKMAQLGMATSAVSSMLYKFIATGTPEMILLWGGIFQVADLTREHLTGFLDALQKKAEAENSTGYAMFRPYAPFTSR